jgi:hypothetical protein
MRRLVLPFLCLAAAPVTAAQAAADLFVMNAPLPAIELPTLDGKGTLRLSELKGTPTVLIQFASW